MRRKLIANSNSLDYSNFAPVTRDVADLAREHMDGKHYYVLVIITDGIITDMPQTKEVSSRVGHAGKTNNCRLLAFYIFKRIIVQCVTRHPINKSNVRNSPYS